MKKLALIGNGGHAREVAFQMGLNEIVRFVDDNFYSQEDDLSLPISRFDPDLYSIMVAISDPKGREEVISRLPNKTSFFSFIHPTSIVSEDLIIGEGSFIGAYSIITTNVKIGSHSILNRSCQIGHDSSIGDYFSGMPGSIVSGNVKIGDRVYLGTNSSIREKINICSDVTIGLNSGIYTDIDSPGKYTSIKQDKIWR